MISINSNTRQFIIPGSDVSFGVEFDNGTERKYFQCPRYVGDNLDIASCFVRINYRNANGETDFYLVDDLTVDGDNIVFSWVLSPKVTAYKGLVKFVMCVIGPDLKLKWHTTQGSGQIYEGLEPDNSHVESDTADVVAQLISMVEAQTAAVEAEGGKQIKAVQTAAASAQAASVAEIEAKGVNTRNSIPADYTALSTTVDELVRGKSGAIVCETDGTAISVSDASDMAMQGLRIFGRSTQNGTPTPTAPVEIVSVAAPVVTVAGKNLLQPKYSVGTHTINGLNFTVGNDGSVTLSGTPTASAGFVFETLYVHEPVILTGCPTGGTTRTYRMTADCYKNDEFVETTFDLGDGLLITPSMADYVNINVFAFAGTVFNNLTFYPMVRVASNPNATYEPYKPIQAVATANTLRGIPVTSGGNYTDANGQQWICDEVDLERGVYVKRVHTENITQVASLNNIADWTEEKSQFTGKLSVNGIVGGTCMVTHGVSGIWFKNHPFYAGVGYPSLCVVGGDRVSFGDTVESCNKYLSSLNAVSPIKMTYVMETPTETPLTEAEIAAYRTLHSNYPNTTVLNDAGAHMVVKYAADTKLYIDKKIKEALQ